MEATTEQTEVTQKTLDLCKCIVDQPEFVQMRKSIDAFLGDEESKKQYQLVMETGESLQHKQQMGTPPDSSEIAEFEKSRDLLLKNPLARGFLDAQEQMHKVQESVMQYVGKTFELGRVPTNDDFDAHGCGTGCGCSH
jgi:cell fate (sporulation/competence/biofilm development) regulator YlbF (YheA/YmcA/DUF963 family)